MLFHHKHISLLLSLLLLPIITLQDHYIINFGIPKSSTTPYSSDTHTWSDDDFAQPPLTTTTTTATTTATSDGALSPYDTGRVFRAPLSYSIPVSSVGPKFVRLYFPSSTTIYETIDTKNAFLSLTINGFQILRNFSAYIFAANADANPNTTAPTSNGLVREIYLTMEKKTLNLTFYPGHPNGFGFINRVEIISVHDGLYANRSSSNQVPYITGGLRDVDSTYDFPNSLAMENIIRLNVGGSTLEPSQDTGFGRAWINDQSYVLSFNDTPTMTYIYNNSANIKYTPSTPSYIAPISVYSTMRTLGSYFAYQKTNMTWGFEVDGGSHYLLRFHFCNLIPKYNQIGQILFNIYVNNQQATSAEIDVNELAGGLDIPIYRDFVTIMDNTSTSDGRAMLWVALVPNKDSPNDDAFLNGLEIFKLNSSIGSLAAPNPTLPMMPVNTPIPTKDSSKHKLPIIVGVTIGAILVSLSALCFIIFYRRKKAKQKFMDTTSQEDSSKMKWVSTFFDSTSNATATATSVGSSLPSDLCRRFTFTQIKIATCDFDDNSIIGTGGFGKVYKGSIDNGATIVAVKRLNSTSKQGAREFQTEIEMLSKLRHVNLVSLIGYCDDHGEMILVYEYMPRGTLREHLLYKNPEKNNAIPLSWKQRLMICVGSAKGLHYLHSGAKQLIIHRDVKSTNILLDDKWTAKVSDFGLSKIGAIGSEGGATHVSTAVKGSIGYLDPEYYRRQQLTEKSDVYSFGVLLFEVLCARPAMNPNLSKEQVNLALWGRSCYKNGILHTIVDPNIKDQIAPESLRKFGDIADTCVRDRGTERPSMGDVVWSLEFVLQLQETAENNAVSVDNEGKLSNHTSFNHENGSTYDDVSNTSGGNFSETSVVLSDSKRLMDSKTTTSVSTSEYPVDDMKSGSVFSEIFDPKAR